MEEYQLALRARENDREALSELVERTRAGLFALALAELRDYDDAHDAVAAALMRICRHIGRLREPERVRAWMQQIVRNEARRLRQRSPVEVVRLEEAGAPETVGPRLLRLDIEQALRRLPRDQARAIALYYLAGAPVRDIAARIGRPEGTIRRWLHHGRQHLATHMEGYAPVTGTVSPTLSSMTAAIISTALASPLLEGMADAMKECGWEVAFLGDMPVVEPVEEGDRLEFRLTEPLRRRRFLVLDEQIGSHSAFELLALLKATPEANNTMIGLLVSSPTESTLWAAWIAGFDLCIGKPISLTEFRTRSIHARLAVTKRAEDLREWAPRFEKHRRAFVFAPLTPRFTGAVYRAAPMRALEEAQRLQSNRVEPEHELLALLGEENNATRLLDWLGVDTERLRTRVEGTLAAGTADPQLQALPWEEQARWSPCLAKVSSFATEEAKQRGEKVAGTEYLLLGLLRLGEGTAHEALVQHGVDLDRLRTALADPAVQSLRWEADE
jgi:RNA polymerase sigma factor (sigma-70 family)